MISIKEYENKRNKLVKEFNSVTEPIKLEKETSNLFRYRSQEKVKKLNVKNFNNVISIDKKKLLCEVEGMCTYESLVEETLSQGYMPTVVPQLKTITIGGALTGIGIESSSFRFGLVHETIEEIEVLTPKGQIVKANKSKNSDLFLGFPNSYGTLGYALKIKVKIIPVKKYVKLTHLRFTDSTEFFNEVEKYSKIKYLDFLDGSIFGENELYLTLGQMTDKIPDKVNISDYTYMNIYFKSIKEKQEDYLTIKDYIWRWDTDWFWCSKHFFAQNPIIRLLFGRKRLRSNTYWKIRDWAHNNLPQRSGESVVQDVEIPIESSSQFLEFFHKKIGILPIWICPTKSSKSVVYPLYKMQHNKLYINFGFWDVVPTNRPRGYHNKLIESEVKKLNGNKSLYSDSYYSEKEFWKIYNQKVYKKLKRKYDPKNRFNNLYEKTVLGK